MADSSRNQHSPAPWQLARGGRSVNLPDGGKIRQEAGLPPDVLAANIALVSAAPELYACALDALVVLELLRCAGIGEESETFAELKRDLKAAVAKAEPA